MAAGQIGKVLFVNVFFALVTLVAGGHQPLADGGVRLQVDDAVRHRDADFIIFKVEQPIQKSGPLLPWQFGALVHRVAGGVAVGDDDAALAVKTAPAGLVAGVAVHRIKGGSGIGVHVARVAAEFAAQIHLDEGRRIAGIVWKGNLLYSSPLRVQRIGQAGRLGGFAASVQAFDHNQSAVHCLNASSFSSAYFFPMAAASPQVIEPSLHAPRTQEGPAMANRAGAMG